MSITKIVHCVFDCRSTKAFMSPIETTFAVNKWTEKKADGVWSQSLFRVFLNHTLSLVCCY